MYLLVLQRLFLEAIADVFYFPIWWYSKGLLRAAMFCVDLFKDGNIRLAPGLWLKNIFVPMYGQYDWQGRIISFFMRLAQIIFRAIVLFLWLIFCAILFLLWLTAPLFVLYELASVFLLIKHAV